MEFATRLLTPSTALHPTTDLLALQAALASGLAMSFLQFAAKAIAAFVSPSGDLVDVTIIDAAVEEQASLWYFGFDGDSTGDFLADAFHLANAEADVAARSRTVRAVLDDLVQLIRRETGRPDAVIFAEGDNVLFKGPFRAPLLAELQSTYRAKTGLTSSIATDEVWRRHRWRCGLRRRAMAIAVSACESKASPMNRLTPRCTRRPPAHRERPRVSANVRQTGMPEIVVPWPREISAILDQCRLCCVRVRTACTSIRMSQTSHRTSTSIATISRPSSGSSRWRWPAISASVQLSCDGFNDC